MIVFDRISLLIVSTLVVFGLLSSVVYADSNGVWLNAEDVRAGTFGGDEGGGDYFFPTGNIAIGTNVSNGKFRVVDSYSGSALSQVLIKGGSYGFQEIFSDGLSDDGDVPYLSFHRGNQIGWQQGLLGNDFVIARGSGANTDDLFPDKYFTITDGGNVGIGTIIPQAKLDVRQNWGSELLPMVNLEASNDGWILKVKNTANENQSDKTIADFQNLAGSVFYVSGDGNIGIGTNVPEDNLHISDLGNSILILHMDKDGNSDSEVSSVEFREGSGSGTLVGSILARTQTGRKTVEINSVSMSDLLLVNGGGNVGIGTLNPTAKLEVSGNIKTVNNVLADRYCDENGANCKDIASITGSVTHGARYYKQVDGAGGDHFCNPGYYVDGVNYDNSGDDHIEGIYCREIS
ncbi:MAG: hypothetical protein KC589_11045 [Nanoarchaeota archaeon]|nr:hypothetical protein [Nanoarchaeota archaeon]